MSTSVSNRSNRPTPPPRLLIAAGGVGGIVGALLGGGTGMVAVPALSRYTALARGVVHGTVAMPNTAVALIGTAAYALGGGAVDLRVGVPMMLGGVLGVQVGARFVARVSARLLALVFVTILVIVGCQMVLEGAGLRLLPHAVGSELGFTSGVVGVTVALALGVVIGTYSAAMGLGGGLLTVPALVLLFGTDMQTALGTSLLVMIPNAGLSILAHARQHTLEPRTGLILASSAIPGAIAGAVIGLATPAYVLNFAFGAFALRIALREIAQLRSGHKTPSQESGTGWH